MNINFHGAEMVSTFSKDETISADLRDRDGNQITLFFDNLDELEQAADELRFLVESIREGEVGEAICGACNGSGMGMTAESRCLICSGSGEA